MIECKFELERGLYYDNGTIILRYIANYIVKSRMIVLFNSFIRPLYTNLLAVPKISMIPEHF